MAYSYRLIAEDGFLLQGSVADRAAYLAVRDRFRARCVGRGVSPDPVGEMSGEGVGVGVDMEVRINLSDLLAMPGQTSSVVLNALGYTEDSDV